jgi:glycosyltransferase involved in cell wall biosynthesis
MTAYNRERYIGEAIESVIKSSYSNWELIIVDDSSCDTTVQIAKAYASNESRITIYQNKVNLGDYPNRNYAASLAKGEYIMYVDSDDKILPDGIKKLVESMGLFPEASFGMYSPIKGVPYLLNSEEAIFKHFFKEPFLMMGPGGTIQRRSFFRVVGGYPEKYGPANDMYYNLKACCLTSIVLMPFEFMYYRRHAGQEINNASSYLYNNYLYLRDALFELQFPITEKQHKWISKKNKRRFLVNVVKYYFHSRDRNKTKAILRRTDFSFADVLTAVFHV